MKTHHLGAAALVLASGMIACADDEDPMGREAVAELARSRGDAQGGARTGTWATRFVEQSCVCPAELSNTVILCDADTTLGFIPVMLRVVEGDGVVTLTPDASSMFDFDLGGELSGPIDADGTFGAGIVTIGVDVSASLVVTSRLEAEMTGDDTFEGDIRVRMRGDIGDVVVECESAYDVDAERLF